MTGTLELSELRAPESWVRRYVSTGAWRDDSIVDDLHYWAATTPEATAIVSRSGTGLTRRISYREYAAAVDRYAAALRGLGAAPGQVVSLWMPTRWPVPALVLACWQAGAVAAPVMTTIGLRELERMLARLGATVCITVDEFAGTGHAARLREAAANLPDLAHQVVLGTPGDGQLNFDGCFESARPIDELTASGPVDPDRFSLVLFTSGTTGEPKAALHTLNTISFYCRDFGARLGLSNEDRLFTPHVCTHAAGLCIDVALPLSLGASALLLEQWDPGAAAELMAGERTSLMIGAPTFTEQLLDTLAAKQIRLPSLRYLYAGAAPVPKPLMSKVRQRLGIPLRAMWAMTEAGSLPGHRRPGQRHCCGPPTARPDGPRGRADLRGRPGRAAADRLRRAGHRSDRQTFLWGYGHYLVFGSAAAIGAGLEMATGQVTGEAHISALAAALAVTVPTTLFSMAVWLVHIRPFKHDVGQQLVFPAATVLILAASFGGHWAVPLTGLACAAGLAVTITLATWSRRRTMVA